MIAPDQFFLNSSLFFFHKSIFIDTPSYSIRLSRNQMMCLYSIELPKFVNLLLTIPYLPSFGIHLKCLLYFYTGL